MLSPHTRHIPCGEPRSLPGDASHDQQDIRPFAPTPLPSRRGDRQRSGSRWTDTKTEDSGADWHRIQINGEVPGEAAWHSGVRRMHAVRSRENVVGRRHMQSRGGEHQPQGLVHELHAEDLSTETARMALARRGALLSPDLAPITVRRHYAENKPPKQRQIWLEPQMPASPGNR